MWSPICDVVELERTERGKEMVELKFEYFRNMEEVVDSFLRNGYKVAIERYVDKTYKQWKYGYLLTAVKDEQEEETE